MTADRPQRFNNLDESLLVSDLGEHAFISKLIAPILGDRGGICLLDDCAVYQVEESTLLLSIDQGPRITFLELLGIGSPQDIGHFLVTINVSDIAAMGGTPTALLLALGLIGDENVHYVRDLLDGITQALDEYGMQLIGGDTKQADIRTTTITVIGEMIEGKPLLRRGARPGDQVFITPGKIGRHLRNYVDAAKGRRLKTDWLVQRPKAEVAFGQYLSKSGIATSCLDMSDGVLRSAAILAETNNVLVSLAPGSIPVSDSPVSGREQEWVDMVLSVGGDFGLMFTTSKEDSGRAMGRGAHWIGEVRERQRGVDQDELLEHVRRSNVWEHFRTVELTTKRLLSFI